MVPNKLTQEAEAQEGRAAGASPIGMPPPVQICLNQSLHAGRCGGAGGGCGRHSFSGQAEEAGGATTAAVRQKAG